MESVRPSIGVAAESGMDDGSGRIVADSPDRVDRDGSDTPAHRDYATPPFRP